MEVLVLCGKNESAVNRCVDAVATLQSRSSQTQTALEPLLADALRQQEKLQVQLETVVHPLVEEIVKLMLEIDGAAAPSTTTV